MLNAAILSLVVATHLPADGVWDAALESPGGTLAFELEFQTDEGRLQAFVINGPERVEVAQVSLRGDTLLLRFDHFDSEIRARLEGDRLDGEWTKRGAGGSLTTMAFSAESRGFREGEPRPRQAEIAARHSVRFESSEDPGVLLIGYEGTDDPWRQTRVNATFMTTTGDYRYLARRTR